jgi:hypothetical protein
MEPFIALLLTVLAACLIGFRLGRHRTLDKGDAKKLTAAYGEYLHAVSAAGLVQLSNRIGELPAREDIETSINGPRLVSDMVKLLDGEKGSTVIEHLQNGNAVTVEGLLARLSDDAEKYWPERSADIRRARESLT